jgi:hypothetical protein
MAKISISEAARLAGISRSHLYAKFIKPGKISVETTEDALGKPQKQIDTAELQRVFGNLTARTEDSQRTGQVRPSVDAIEDRQDNHEDRHLVPVLQERVRGLEALLRVKDETLAQARTEQGRLLGIIENQTRLLEHQAIKSAPSAPEMPDKPQQAVRQVLVWVLILCVLVAAALVTYREYSGEGVQGTAPAPAKTSKDSGQRWKPDDEGA